MRNLQLFFSTSFRHGGRNGFSLVEVVLALAIVSFSLVGILSIFPVALDTAADSKTETRVTLVAQNIISDLMVSPPSAAVVLTNAVALPESYSAPASLSTFTTVYVAYNEEGRPIRGITPELFAKYTNSDAAFLASISSTVNSTTPKGLALINVSIQAPPQANNSGNTRKKYYFAAYLPSS